MEQIIANLKRRREECLKRLTNILVNPHKIIGDQNDLRIFSEDNSAGFSFSALNSMNSAITKLENGASIKDLDGLELTQVCKSFIQNHDLANEVVDALNIKLWNLIRKK